MRPTLNRRSTLLGLAFAAAFTLAASLLPAPAADALTCRRMQEIEYYFDAAKTQYAGFCVVFCNGTRTCEGTVTIYRTQYATDYCACTF
jgi:hypothetical protein